MTVIDLLYDFFVCSMATFFFAILFKSPKNSLFICSVLGGFSYVIYDFCHLNIGIIFGYFFGTFFISVFSEIFARVMKMPATIFIIPAVIPLVPGVNLYHAMRYFISNQVSQGVNESFKTLAYAGVMAIAIALAPMIIKVWKSGKSVLRQ